MADTIFVLIIKMQVCCRRVSVVGIQANREMEEHEPWERHDILHNYIASGKHKTNTGATIAVCSRRRRLIGTRRQTIIIIITT